MENIFQATVSALSHEGQGVVTHPDGRVFFVKGVFPGDEGRFAILPPPPHRPKKEVFKKQRRYGRAKLVDLLVPSPDRIPSSCPHRGYLPGQCGGCPWLPLRYEVQLKYKESKIPHFLRRVGLTIPPEIIKPIWPSPKIFQYRNRAQLKTNGTQIGFVSDEINRLAPIKECLILSEKNQQTLADLQAQLPQVDWKPGAGFEWNYLDIDEEIEAKDVVLNRRRPFQQGNSEQNKRMKTYLAQEFSRFPLQTPILELFAGSGNFTEVFSALGFQKILAVEVQSKALFQLQKRQLPGVRVEALDLFGKGVWSRLKSFIPDAKILVLDPPRAGLTKRKAFPSTFAHLDWIYYISCEPETFVRDASFFHKHGWILQEIQPLDLFPHTPHVELIAKLKKIPIC